MPGSNYELVAPDDAPYRVIEQHRSSRKLRIGSHRFNRFRVHLRDVDGWDEATEQRLALSGQQGMANYFGEQRFGRYQDNVEQALSQLGCKRLSRQKRSIYLSALRSLLFNQVLSRRIERGLWREPLSGDCFMLSGSRSFFIASIDEEILERYRQQDISSCGSLYGSGDSPLSSEALQLEQDIEKQNPQITAVLQREKTRRQMRALRVAVDELQYEYDEQQRSLLLTCRLPAGSYLTSLLDHVVLTNQQAG